MTLDVSSAESNLLATIQQEYKIIAEYKMLQSEDVGGVYVIPSSETSFVWYGVIFVRDGFFKDGVFRFTMFLPDDFPNTTVVPTIILQSKLFHPLIHPETNQLDTSSAFPTWHQNENHIWQLLKFIQYAFLHPMVGAPQYEEAASLYQENLEAFKIKAAECVQMSKDKLMDPPTVDDKHFIVFGKYDAEVHDMTLDTMKNKTDQSISTSGLSWVKEDEYKPLAK